MYMGHAVEQLVEALRYKSEQFQLSHAPDAPDDEQKYCSKHPEQSRNIKLSYTVASCWPFSYIK
jgi:hypothetical protein